MKVVYVGKESEGKTLFLTKELTFLLKRNIGWFKKYGFRRLIYTNLTLSDYYYNKYKDYIRYWSSVDELTELSGVDILWDEISNDFSALKLEPLPKHIKVWLRQGAKQGNRIYATTQEYHTVHLDFRRLVKVAYKCKKFIGSDRGGKNLPPVKYIWGWCFKRRLVIDPYNELTPMCSGWPSPLWIGRKLCSYFNTYVLVGTTIENPPLEHIERVCKTCGIKTIKHK